MGDNHFMFISASVADILPYLFSYETS